MSKHFHTALLFFIGFAFSLVSCSGEEESDTSDLEVEETDFNDTYNELQGELIDPVWQKQTDGEYFEIEIPTEMHEEDSLNVEASLQYGYLDKVEGVVKENYIIVLVHDKAELKDDKDNAFEYNVENYNELAKENLLEGKLLDESFNETEKVDINGNSAVINEIKAGIKMMDGRVVDVYYMLGVIEGEKAFYQVLTWTLWEQKSDFKADMKHMILSFQEK